MSRSRRESRLGKIFDDPFYNGLVALLVVLAAVYTSYTANNGIPFVPVYKVTIDVPDAGQLVRHAEVRVGGARVGQVLKIEPVNRTETQPPHARLELAVDPELEPFARDTRSEVRVASILGGKYIGIEPGKGADKLRKGEILPLSRSKSVVDLDQAFRVFTPKTQQAVRDTVGEIGNALAGRGVAFNRSIHELAVGTTPLQRVLALLAAPQTNLAGFISGAAATVSTLAPLTDTFIETMRDGATTLGAVNAAGPALGRALDALPGAVSQTTTTLVHLRPALAAAADITRALEPTAELVPPTLAKLDATLRAATPAARDIRTLAPALNAAFKAVNKFSKDRLAIDAIKVLGTNDFGTLGASGLIGLGGIFAAIAPAQINCNILGIFARNVASTLSEGDAQGSWLPLVPMLGYLGAPINNKGATLDPQLHINALPNENAEECEAGNEPFASGQAVGNPPGNQAKKTDESSPPASATARARAAGLLEEAR